MTFRSALPWVFLILLWGGAFSLACLLVPAMEDRSSASSLGTLLLVGSQGALSDSFFEEADVYFHRGVKDVHQRPVELGGFQRLERDISPAIHIHAAGHQIREIMPWLRLATRVNPHNIEAYRVAAFWLAGAAGAPDQAMKVLREAAMANPGDYRIQMEKCHLLLTQQRFREAGQALDCALRLWPSGEKADNDQARLDKGELLLFRAMLCEMDNRKQDALNAFSDILAIFPDRTTMRDQMEALRKSDRPAELALKMLNILLISNPHAWDEDKDEDEPGAHAEGK